MSTVEDKKKAALERQQKLKDEAAARKQKQEEERAAAKQEREEKEAARQAAIQKQKDDAEQKRQQAKEKAGADKLGETLAQQWGVTYKIDLETAIGGGGLKSAIEALIDPAGQLENHWKGKNYLAGCLSHFFVKTYVPDSEDSDVKAAEQVLLPLAGQLFDTVVDIILSPDDSEVADGDYGDKGKQTFAAKLAKLLRDIAGNKRCSTELCTRLWELVVPAAQKIVAAKPALKGDSPASKKIRSEAVQDLIRVGPSAFIRSFPVPKQLVSVLADFVALAGPSWPVSAAVKNSAVHAIQAAISKDGTAVQGQVRVLFVLANEGDQQMIRLITTSVMNGAYDTDPEVFDNNVEFVIEKIGFPTCFPLLNKMAQKNPALLAQHVPLLKAKMKEDPTRVFTIFVLIRAVAAVQPDAVYNEVVLDDSFRALCSGVQNADVSYAGLLSDCGKAKVAGGGEKVTLMLCEMLKSDPPVSNLAVPVVLSGICNLLPNLNGNTKLLDPYVDAITSYKSSSAILVEKILDFHAGRSLELLANRIDVLEQQVAQLNNKVSQTCANFEDVKKYVDQNISEVKELMAEVVKRLPTPVKLTVVGGVRKTLILHFECARTKEIVTTETKEWNKWIKIGFSAIALGKCVADCVVGNPMNLGNGVSAIKNIYSAYKAKDDADFDTFVRQPFLTSAESDKLIEQLRDAKFFEQMAYAPQIANWVVVSSLTVEEAEKAGMMKEREAQILANQTKQKSSLASNVGAVAAGVVGGVLQATGNGDVLSVAKAGAKAAENADIGGGSSSSSSSSSTNVKASPQASSSDATAAAATTPTKKKKGGCIAF